MVEDNGLDKGIEGFADAPDFGEGAETCGACMDLTVRRADLSVVKA